MVKPMTITEGNAYGGKVKYPIAEAERDDGVILSIVPNNARLLKPGDKIDSWDVQLYGGRTAYGAPDVTTNLNEYIVDGTLEDFGELVDMFGKRFFSGIAAQEMFRDFEESFRRKIFEMRQELSKK